ncbi:MAG TPA: methyltransferase domain-containing protein [Acidimicrobiales bacterium]|nr:methyltransferase domain-containing protein [Acidimicrobiales bacterium]
MEHRTLAQQIAEHEQWYHTMELLPGVVTPGWFDTRPLVARLPLPATLDGARCLDVGTFDGFWAFEMERRGAAEVVAIDVLDPKAWDWPVNSSPDTVRAIGERKARGEGFELAKAALGSRVVRHELSVYDLNPVELGAFDFVYLGSLLLHLQNPVRALERVRTVCRGTALVVDAVDSTLSAVFPRWPVASLDALGRPWWWKPNAAGLRRMVEAAGFEVLEPPRRLRITRGPGRSAPPLSLGALRHRAGREALASHWRGDAHAAVVARPR